MDIPTMALVVQTFGVVGTLTAATIAVRSYLISNKRAEEARKRELETRQAQLFMGLYQSLYSSHFTQAEFTLWSIELKNEADMKRLMEDNMDEYSAWNTYCTYYEGLGVLVRENLIDVGLVAKLMSGMIIQFWDRYREVILDCRRAWNWSRFLVEVEYLSDAVIKYGREHPELGIALPGDTMLNRSKNPSATPEP